MITIKGETCVSPERELATENLFVCANVQNFKTDRRAGNLIGCRRQILQWIHFAETTEVIAYHRLLGKAGDITGLVHMDGGAPTHRIVPGIELYAHRPKLVR